MNVSIADCLAIAFAAGFLFGIAYELFRIIRLIMRLKAVVFLSDLMFFIAAAFAVIKLSESLGNYVRIYTVIGFGLGIFAYIVTVGRLFNLIESSMAVVWRKTLGRLFKKIGNFLGKTFGKVVHKISAVFVKISENIVENRKKARKDLHLKQDVVYNKNRLDKIGEGGNKNVIKAVVRRSP